MTRDKVLLGLVANIRKPTPQFLGASKVTIVGGDSFHPDRVVCTGMGKSCARERAWVKISNLSKLRTEELEAVKADGEFNWVVFYDATSAHTKAQELVRLGATLD